MNKQQLANRIWSAADELRSSIDAAEYKDYILGFVFYKYLSENEVAFLFENDWTEEDILEDLNESNERDVTYIKKELGYFIDYEGLYSTWIDPSFDFGVDTVITALNAFERNINPDYRDVYGKIFDTLSNKITKLGETPAKQTAAILDILKLIKPIPMTSAEGYDVLGFIYEYLISNFAANAGKKAGEFYTPHEVSELMSDIVAYHLRDKTEISIYDPTSGSASLLLNIGQSIARHNGNPEGIKYYAQERNDSTYNLTRMNLIMKDIKPANIATRRADTLDEDWPRKSDADEPLRVDACVSNPPYSQKWKPKEKEHDPRFSYYGLAPKGKADYAFLLHSLYHLLPDGIMTIVLPHGVLFRGDSEGEIRKRLVDDGNIDAIIGLPANIFFGTGIPTIVMVLKPERDRDDILFIDASKGFIKDGKKNKLRAQDIRRAFDAYVNRKSIEGYCAVVDKQTIIDNDYNLNIPRYVDSSEPAEPWDIFSLMYGGIPVQEIDDLRKYWDALPGLRDALYEANGHCAHIKTDNVIDVIRNHPSVKAYRDNYQTAWAGFDKELSSVLIDDVMNVHPVADEDRFVSSIFERLHDIPLVDPYDVFELFDNQWNSIVDDLEIIQGEGLEALTTVDEHFVLKKKDGKEEEVIDKIEPWIGRILPFDLVQHILLCEEVGEIGELETRQASYITEIEAIFNDLTDEELEGSFVKDNNEEFNFTELSNAIEELLCDESDEIAALVDYRALGTSKDIKDKRIQFTAKHPEVTWNSMKASGGVYSAKAVNNRIAELRDALAIDEDSLLGRLIKVSLFNDQSKEVGKELKHKRAELHENTKDVIENLSTEQALELLKSKWIKVFLEELNSIPENILKELEQAVRALNDKYSSTYEDIENEIITTEASLVEMLGQLTGNKDDMSGINELMQLLEGE